MSKIGFSANKDALTSLDHVAAGGLSSAATRAVCQPLDVLKIRMQLQVEDFSRGKYRNMFHAAGTIFREEGAAAFWKGHMPAQYLSISYGICQFYAFECLTKAAAPWTAGEDSGGGARKATVHFLMGGAGGVAGTLMSYPFDVVRTRLVAQAGRQRYYNGTLDAAAKMYRREGARAFFKGIIPTFATIAPYSGCQFGFYSLFTSIFDSLVIRKDEDRITMSGSLACGALAGLCAKTVVFPFDVTKKRLQVAGFEEGRRGLGETGAYKGMVDCMTKVVRNEGLRGLFKGLSPGLVKAVATTAVNFWLYEYILNLIALRHRKEEE